jgi:predicted HTH transcriptional regulator
MDLVDLLKRPEGKTLEFKRELSGPEGLLKTIVAFANTAGGTLLLGVEDRTGHVRGVTEPLDLEERLANLISDHVAPRLVPEIEILPWRRTQGLAVQVHPSPTRPHYLKREKADALLNQRLSAPFRGDANDHLYQWESSRDYNPSPGLERIQATLLAINSAADERNPPELGVLDREVKRVKRGRVLLIPGSEDTCGHGTTFRATF